ncbi:MAG: succinylglutamate desuccinylase/aspartoacylase family protein [Rhizobacter sp.]
MASSPVTSPKFGHLRAHQFAGLSPGPRLIVLGGVHGNEVCGTIALRRLLGEFERGERAVVRGLLTLVPAANPLAGARGTREGERNLNRRLVPHPEPADYEDHLANVLCPMLAAHDVLLDLHSFHTDGRPFAMIGPPDNSGPLEPFAHADAETRLAMHLGPTRLVEGWLETYAKGAERRGPADDPTYGVGTTEYMRSRGGYGITLECGQHEDPQAPEVAYRAVVQTLALLGLVDDPPAPPAPAFQLLDLVDVVDRHHPEDRFVREWCSFDAVAAGEPIGIRHDGSTVAAPADGHVVFPNPGAAPGAEWFYFAVPGHRAQIPAKAT